MSKKLLFVLLLIFPFIYVKGQITFTTTSVSSSWSPLLVTKSGAEMTWTAAANGVFAGQIVNANDPTFDFSSNDGTPIEVTVVSPDGFSGLTQLDFLTDYPTGGLITDIDLSDATSLTFLNTRYNALQQLDVSQNTALTDLIIRGNRQFTDYSFNTNTNSQLRFIFADNTRINSFDFSNNPLLTDVQIYDARLTSAVLDQVLIDLDNHGLSNGNLEIRNQTTGQSITTASLSAYNNLIAKGWTIDVPAPTIDLDPPVIGVLNAASNVTTSSLTLSWTAATDNIGVVGYKIFRNNSLVATVGNVLSYVVSGLFPSTTYSFYITAFDNENNESANSNIIQATTLNQSAGSSFTFTTTSVSSSWSPLLVTKSGAVMTWTAATNGIFAGQVVNANDPTFDFSSNDGSPIEVTVTSSDGFIGLTQLDFLTDFPTGGLITNIDLSNATALTLLNTRYNSLQQLDVSQNTALTDLIIRGNRQFTDYAFNTTSNTQLTFIFADNTRINSFDFANNPLLTNVQIYDARLTSAVLDQVLIDLDNHGLSGGNLEIRNQTTGQSITFNSLIAYNNLIGKGWTIDVPAPAAAPGPEINVTLEGTSIPTGNVPAIADGTDFGQVAIGTPVTKTFTIQNLGDSNLIISFAGLYATPPGSAPGFSSVELPGFPPFSTTILPGLSSIFTVTFNPATVGVQSVSVGISHNDTNENPYIINLRAEGVTTLANPTIVVLGNSVPIVNGDNTPDVADDTNFGQIINNGTQINTFTIANNGTGNLSVSNINVVNFQNTEFSVESLTYPIVIAEGSSFDFDVTFSPLSSGIYSAAVQISHSDIDETSPYSFRVTGEGIVAPAEVMITQYYEGANNDKWIEVRNISGNSIPANTYYLALYDQSSARAGIIDINSPTQSEPIPALGVNQTVLFRNGAAALPGAGNIGGAIQIVTNVCTFSQGDDVILISTSNGADCYNNRVDIIGNVSAGPGLSPDPMTSPATYIKGGCSSESAHLVYNETDWTLINVLDVNNANPNTNLALGTQTVGSTTFNGSVWSNLAPDQSRIAIISASFSGAGSSIFACDLIINPGVNVVFDSNSTSTNSIVVYDDLTVNGSLTIGDQESLVTYKDNAALGVITKIEKSKPLTNIHDVTYWSSPVQGSQTNVIFNGVDPTRIFRYGPELGENPIYAGTEYRYWYQYSGGMERGRGYAAEGSSTGVQTLTFTGVPYNGNFTRQIWYSGDEDDQLDENDNFNLIGNPYPAAININLFLSNNAYVNEIALWSHATPISGGDSGSFTDADYILYNLFGSIPQGAATYNIGSSQGFMARTTNPGGAAGLYNVIYDNEFKLVGLNDQFFKSENSKKSIESKDERDRIWLRLGDGRSKDEILVGFFNETTDGIDSRYDAAGGLGNKSIRFYSQMENYRLAIQALGVFSPEKSVPLGFKIKEAKDLTISMSGKEGIFRDMDIYLVDHALNKTHNLKEGDYTFTQTTTGDFPNRFTLQFSKNAVDVDKIIEGSEFNVFNSAEGFRINASKVVKEVKVYDMLGRTIMSSKPNQQSFYLNAGNLKTGAVLIFEVKLENGTILNKKAIRM